uniref:Small ribosomal subunit protein bS18c n=1 Tax=Haptophyceae sp. NIES-3900 TaxID=2748608 RepID=A0A7R7AKB7_9EUKA|nr:ribosomal protein S18 [Haptophyceae sp. NIES-3900]
MDSYSLKSSPAEKSNTFNYKDIDSLRKYITEQGKILPRRSTGLGVQQQKNLTKAIKRARMVSLLPFIFRDN